jgi:small GTP-binding protein
MYNSKVVVLGNSTVGKSTMLQYFKNNRFIDKMESTIGCDFFARIVTTDEGKDVKLLCWDCAGQEIFRSFTSNFLRGAAIIIIVYDITSIESFDSIESWLPETDSQPKAKIVICGNKSDLKPKIKSLSYIDQLKKLYPNKEIHYFGEVSSKLGTNIEELFKFVAKLIIDNNNTDYNMYNNTIKIDYNSKPKNEDKCSC